MEHVRIRKQICDVGHVYSNKKVISSSFEDALWSVFKSCWDGTDQQVIKAKRDIANTENSFFHATILITRFTPIGMLIRSFLMNYLYLIKRSAQKDAFFC